MKITFFIFLFALSLQNYFVDDKPCSNFLFEARICLESYETEIKK